MSILLLEPAYLNKYPPIGLMKIAYFHRVMRQEDVYFAKGKLPDGFTPRHWSRIYVTTLFTFEYRKSIEAINYAKSIASDDTEIIVGGIAATLMPERFEADTGIRPCVGLLNEAGKLGLPHDECIDQLPLDYSILEQISYVYPFHDAYFLSATKGCGMRCGFCAVQRLEPRFIPYSDIKEKVRTIDREFGPKKDLLLMDNNVLVSRQFDRIIDDILELGFERGATYRNPRTGKIVKRYVDFNQGLDAKLITPEKARRLGEIALSPARIAFDHIEDERDYVRAIELCTQYGVTEMSNYLLYNSEDFSGKGNRYQADTPENMYERLRITLDLQTRLNASRPADAERVSIFSFPMRYIPLDATERGYIGSHWNAKYLRSMQCMLIPTQGKGVGSVSFFEADFGRSPDEFVENLCMPERLMTARGHFVERKNESDCERAERYEEWQEKHAAINEWRRLFRMLENEKDEFIAVIGDNEYLPEKLLKLQSTLQQKLYYHYLTPARVLKLLGSLDHNSQTYKTLHRYITEEMPTMYKRLQAVMLREAIQQQHQIRDYIAFFGAEGLQILFAKLAPVDFDRDDLLAVWAKASDKNNDLFFDFSLLRLYRRYIELDCLSEVDHQLAKEAIVQLEVETLRSILAQNYETMVKQVEKTFEEENGKKLLQEVQKRVMDRLQLSFFPMMEE